MVPLVQSVVVTSLICRMEWLLMPNNGIIG